MIEESMSPERDALKLIEDLANADIDLRKDDDGEIELVFIPLEELHELVERATKLAKEFSRCSECSRPMIENDVFGTLCDECFLKRENEESK